MAVHASINCVSRKNIAFYRWGGYLPTESDVSAPGPDQNVLRWPDTFTDHLDFLEWVLP